MEQVTIGGEIYRFFCRTGEKPRIREGLNQLAEQTFGIRLEDWGEDYRPYILFDGERAAANVSVNRMDFRLHGRERRYIQLGTVMTHPDYRGRGLSRWLMERVLREWGGRCDALYLFANDSVLDFYPRFGFRKEEEVRFSREMAPGPGRVRRLNPDNPEDWQLVRRCFRRGNPFSALELREGNTLLAFYCRWPEAPYRQRLYYLEERDAVAVADCQGETLELLEVFGGKGELLPLAECLAAPETRTVVLGFAPETAEGWKQAPLREEDTTLFVWNGGGASFMGEALRFPALSHA